MRSARTCFGGCALPVLVLLGLGTVAYIRALPADKNTNNRISLHNLKQAVLSIWPESTNASVSIPPPVPILMYHYIRDGVDQATDPIGYSLSVTPENFSKQVSYLRRAGFTGITLKQLYQGELPPKPIVLTFDDGYKDFINTAWPILNENGFLATVFVISDRLNDPRHLDKSDLITLVQAGVEIGSHTKSHVNLLNQSDEALLEELSQSQKDLEAIVKRPVRSFSYPAGKYSSEVIDSVKKTGYLAAVTTDSPSDQSLTWWALPRYRISRTLTESTFASLIITDKDRDSSL